jgi:hypothetical protein
MIYKLLAIIDHEDGTPTDTGAFVLGEFQTEQDAEDYACELEVQRPELPDKITVDDFVLTNPPPKPEPYRGELAPVCRQKMLITGLSLLPGQLDLFDETPETPRSLPCDCQANTNRPA